MISIVILYNIKKFYLSSTIYFRGRMYTPGLISPTADKVLRSNLRPFNANTGDNFINMDATASMLQILPVITHGVELSKITKITSDKPIDT